MSRDETAAAPRITVTPEGNVGLYTNAPGSYRLYVNGITYSVGGYQSSDVDYKENIGLIESPLSKILAMEGVSFSWRKSTRYRGQAATFNGGGER